MDLTAVTTALTGLTYPLLVATSVAMARAMGMIMLTPAFTRLGLTGMIRSAVAFAISLPVVPGLFVDLQGMGTPSVLGLSGLVAKELAVGAVIGLIFGIPFWAAEVAGELIDLQRGSTMSQLVDPLSAGESSVTSTFLSIAMVALFFMSGGFLFLLDGLYGSYGLWPAGAMMPVMNAATAEAMLSVLDRILQVGLVLVSPIVIAILITDVMMAFLSRMAPQLHIFDLSLAVKNLLYSALITVYVVFLTPLMFQQVMALDGRLEMLRRLVLP
ncbi:type III secretion system export apparatus subunit SctT [Falsirhodobacter sp. 20TX0035]|uniref:type III secretion system export apparatus subunit SctT n=1 Tax=Falsirhodobacter sp. 20TX0035 TaxID=3022019 RepID=UPI00232FB2DD|nr:type III secretion system export apparatus subunit SctT [Falsirhodobacter sp. 20TX0035]MDB6454396.1 type III secretion system export apparatus subunit SctT [Falsirhodobacter sp. 20TX0035]